jgi:hypothetical protein
LIIDIKDLLDFAVTALANDFALGCRLHLDLKTKLTAEFRFEYLVNVGDEASTIDLSGVLGTAGGLLVASSCAELINAESLSTAGVVGLIQGNVYTNDGLKVIIANWSKPI